MASRNLITFITTILLVITPAFGGTLYAANKECFLYSIDPDTRDVMVIGDGDEDYCHEFAYNCMDQTMYVSFGIDAMFAEIDIINADIGDKTGFTSGNEFPALEFVDGTLYGWSKKDLSTDPAAGFSIIDPATGDDNIINPATGELNIKLGGLAYDICTNIMYGVTSSDLKVSWLVSIPLDTGLPTYIGLTNVNTISSLTFGNGVLYGTTTGSDSPGNLYTIDIETGEATLFQTIIETDEQKIGALSYVSDDGLCESCPTQAPTQIPTKAPTQITNNPTPSPTNDSDSPDCDCDCENSSSSSESSDEDNASFATNKEDEAMDDMSENEGKADRVVNVIIDDTILYYCWLVVIIVLFAIVCIYYLFLYDKK